MSNDEFLMTAYERKSLEIQQKMLDFLYELHADLGALRGQIESLTEAIDDLADAEDDVSTEQGQIKFPLIPTGPTGAGGQVYFNTTPYNGPLGHMISGINATTATLTNSANGDAKKLKDDGPRDPNAIIAKSKKLK